MHTHLSEEALINNAHSRIIELFPYEEIRAENIKMKQLNKKLKDVEEENKILKKALAIFSQQSK